jgi:hypothetical protein
MPRAPPPSGLLNRVAHGAEQLFPPGAVLFKATMRAALHRLDRKSNVALANQHDHGASRRPLFGGEFLERFQCGKVRQVVIEDQAIWPPRAAQFKRTEAALRFDNYIAVRRIARKRVTHSDAVFRRGGSDQHGESLFFHIHL